MNLGHGLGLTFPVGQVIRGGAPVPQAPIITAPPVVSGVARVGETLTTTTGTATGDTPITYEYRWISSADGVTGWSTIAGATAATFAQTVTQQGLYLRSQVRATNAVGNSGWVSSNVVGPVSAALAAPVLVTAPGVSGVFQVGQTLSIDPAAVYSGNPAPTIQYRWQMRPNGGGTITTLPTDPTFTLTSAQEGMQIRSQYMATNSQGSTVWTGAAWLGPVTAAPTGPTLKAGTLTNPAFAMMPNWDGIYGNNNSPFLDWLKLGSEWETSGSTTSMGWAALQAAGHITADGTINSVPPGADNIGMRVLSGIPAGSNTGSGRYRLYFTGDGGIGLNGAGSVDWPATGQAEFNYTATGGAFVTILVDRVDSPIKFQALVHEDDWAAYEAGEVFRPAWLDLIRNNRVIRFTDWMEVDYYQGTGLWANRYTPGRITYQGGEGVPVEVMCDLCNLIGADPWFSFVSNADDNYVTQFATTALSRLGSARHPYVELSNKIWDGANWATAEHFRDMAISLFGDGGIEACMEAYGGRSSEVFDLWRAVWSGANAARVHTVLQAWTPNAYISEFAMTAPRWVALQSGRAAPYTKATEWALHANLDGGMRYEDDEHPNIITTIQGWFDTLTDTQIFDNMADAMRNGNASIGSGYTMAGLATAYADHKALLAYYGGTLNPICYEGGSHLAVPPSRNGNSQWISKYLAFYRSAQFTSVWSDSITSTWYGAFGPSSFYTRKNDIRLPDANNGYGLLRWPGDTAGNLQLSAWGTLQAARSGATGRGATAFTGPYDYEPSGSGA